MLWRAWYATSRTEWRVYSSADTPWQQIPPGASPEGVVGVVVYLSETVTPFRRIVDGGDWYWLEDGKIEYVPTHEEWGRFAPAPHVGCLSCLKRSGVMDDDAWERVRGEMMAAEDAP